MKPYSTQDVNGCIVWYFWHHCLKEMSCPPTPSGSLRLFVALRRRRWARGRAAKATRFRPRRSWPIGPKAPRLVFNFVVLLLYVLVCVLLCCCFLVWFCLLICLCLIGPKAPRLLRERLLPVCITISSGPSPAEYCAGQTETLAKILSAESLRSERGIRCSLVFMTV